QRLPDGLRPPTRRTIMAVEGEHMSTVASSTPAPITTGPTGPLLTLREKAVEKVKYFAGTMPDSQNKPLRIFIQGGGCSGFQYGFTFDEKKENDTVLETGGITVVVDPQRAQYLKDAKGG